MLGHTAAGKDLSPKVASKLDVGLVSDVIDIEITGETLSLLVRFIPGKRLRKRL